LIFHSQDFSFIDPEEEDMVAGEEYIQIQKLKELRGPQKPELPSLHIGDVVSKPFGYGSIDSTDLDFKILIDMRRQHQTKQAFSGVCKRLINKTSKIRSTIIQEFHSALKEAQDETAIGTGIERNVRWRAAAPGGRGGIVDGVILDDLAAGNAANAASVAGAAVKKVWIKVTSICIYLCMLYRLTGCGSTSAHPEGSASAEFGRTGWCSCVCLSAIKAWWLWLSDDHRGCYACERYSPSGLHLILCSILTIPLVIALYSKTGGKSGKHANITESSNISAVSYLNVQVFQHNVSRQFSTHPEAMMPFQTKQFLQVPPHQFLCLVESKVLAVDGSSFVEVSSTDYTRFRSLERGQQQLETALRLFRKRKTGGSDEENWYVAYIAIYILFSISQLCLCYCCCAKIKKNRGSGQNSSQKLPGSLIRTKLRILAEPRYNPDKFSFQGSGQKSHFRDQGSIGIAGGPFPALPFPFFPF